MNLSFVAGRVEMTPEVKEKLRKANLGKKYGKITTDKRKKFLIGNKFRLGKRISEEEKRKISIFHTGNKWNLGRKHPKGSYDIRSAKRKKPINQIDLTTNQILKVWDSAKEARTTLGYKSNSLINDACKGKIKSAYGFKWQYLTSTQ